MSDIDDSIKALIREALKAGPTGRARTSEVRQAIVKNLGSIKLMQAKGFRNAAIARILGDVPATANRPAKLGIGIRWETLRKYIDEYAPNPKFSPSYEGKRAKRTASVLVDSSSECQSAESPSAPESKPSPYTFGSAYGSRQSE